MSRKLEFVVDEELSGARFATPMLIAGIVAATLFSLYALFPKNDLYSEITRTATPSAITVSYLKNLLRAEPKNLHIRLMYAQQLVALHRFSEAQELIKTLRSAPVEYQNAALFLQYQIKRKQFYAAPLNSKTRLDDRQEVIDLLMRQKSLRLSSTQLIDLIDDATYLKKTALVMHLFLQLKPKNRALTVAQAQSVALNAERNKLYRLSAQYYFIAQRKSKTLSQKRKFYISAVNSLLMGGQVKLAVQLGRKNLGALSDDQETLNYLTKVALQSNSLKDAEKSITNAIGLEKKTL